MKSTRTLSALPPGQKAVVQRVGGPRALRRRLMEMGLLPGTEIEVIRAAPMRDPIELSLRGYRLSIRLAEAAQVTLAPPVELSSTVATDDHALEQAA
ncbi:MAG: ferrous iron transport protein A [Deltaproteobacteria bacterium]|nr:ferrous iron transport protein A [Deltaproteobacteria bacterium]